MEHQIGVRRCGQGEREPDGETERLEDAVLQALKTKEGVTSQGIQMASRR